MWPFDLLKKPDTSLLPDIVRKDVGDSYKSILSQYQSQRVAKGEKLALCLVGGGSKGRWQVGFLAYLAQIGALEQFDVIAGTSVGGLNSVMTAKYRKDFQQVVDVWRSIKSNDGVYKGSIPNSFFSGLGALLAGKLTGASILDTSPLQALVKKHLDGITQFDIPVYTVTTDYVTASRRVLGPGTPAVDMALSTSAVPVAFPAYQGKYMDGGCVMNAPYPFLIEECGATKIVVLYCDPDMSKKPASAPMPTTISTGTQALSALYSVQEEEAFWDLEKTMELRKLKGLPAIEVAHFYPSVDTGTLLDFGAKPGLLQKGYDDAVQYATPEKVSTFLLS